MLVNVIFYLGGTPCVCFETHDVELICWDAFNDKIQELLGNSHADQLAAKQALSARVQASSEPYVIYIQDPWLSATKADAHMEEQENVAHILKGIDDDAFNLLVFNNVSTVNRAIKECRRLEFRKSR